MGSQIQKQFEQLLEQDVTEGKAGAPERLAAYKAAQSKVKNTDSDIQSFLVFLKFYYAYHGIEASER